MSNKGLIEVRDFRSKAYFMVDDLFVSHYARVLGPSVVVVYLVLCRHANRDQESWPSIELISKTSSFSTKTVKRALKKLSDFKLIHRLRTRNSKGQLGKNCYSLLDKSLWGFNQGSLVSHGPGVTGVHNQGSPMTPHKVTHKKVLIKKIEKQKRSDPPPKEWKDLLSKLSTGQKPRQKTLKGCSV